MVRYEEMSLKPLEVIPEMFDFFGLQYHKDVDTFLKVTDMCLLYLCAVPTVFVRFQCVVSIQGG